MPVLRPWHRPWEVRLAARIPGKSKTGFAGSGLPQGRFWRTSETGRMRFRGVQFQTPNSVSFSGLTEFRGANSASSSRPIICARRNSPSFSQNSPSLPQNSVRLSEFSSPKQYSRNSIPPVSRNNLFHLNWEEPSMDQYQRRGKLLTNFQRHWSMRIFP